MGKKSAPKAPEEIGQAALMSAELGERYLDMMQGLSDETMAWSREDRERQMSVFRPLEDRYIAEAVNYASPERMTKAANEAAADVTQQSAIARQSSQRNMAALGVNPASGRFASEDRRLTAGEALATAGAKNMARRGVEAVAEGKMANAINMGNNTAISPGSLAGLSGSQASQGYSGAMQGYGQMGNLFNAQFGNQLQSWQAQQQMYGGIGGALGSIAGVILSSKNAKTEKRRPGVSILDAVKNMPVEEWEYKEGQGDGGGRKHVGPYAEDFAKETGLGDGKTISIIDAIGVSIGATKELAEKVDRLEDRISAGAPTPRRESPRRREQPRAVARPVTAPRREPISVM